jgi:hypothetical protein
MQSAGETDADTCAYNDIGLIRLDPADFGKVNPSVPTLGGPTGLGQTTATGDDVYSYGNSSLRGGDARRPGRHAGGRHRAVHGLDRRLIATLQA